MEATISKAEYEAAMAEKDGQIAMLRHELDQLKRLIFASKSERFVPAFQPEQMALWDDSPELGAAQEETEKITYERTKKKAHPGRTQLPEHLPVRRQIIEPEEDTSGMVRIGEEVTRKVDYTPGVLEIVEYVRPKYARPEGEQEEKGAIVIAEVPDQVIPKGIAAVGLLVQLIIAKYIDHLPFYRQIGMFKRDFGWTIHKSTINDWFATVCTLLEPLYDALQKDVLNTDYLQGDESRIQVLDCTDSKSKKGKPNTNTHLGYMWVFRNPVSGNVMFTYRSGRGANVLHETLGGFMGRLQSDGYSAYSSYIKKHNVELVSCLAHIRRKFFEAQKNHPEKAEYALEEIQRLYAIEQIAREENFSPDERLGLRKVMAAPIYYQLLEWVHTEQANNLTKGAIGKALLYAKNHLPRLEHYLRDGRIEIDNNQIENKIRPLALGRKNYLFAGSNQGAQRAAMMYSFFASCKANDINPREWLRDVLIRIGSHPINRLEELLPVQWAASRDSDL
ncbi:MAG: IS66 family transposase [Lewinellaceae bacterium]|nr:IS66 family transposase [Lewinellaceae bacterium]